MPPLIPAAKFLLVLPRITAHPPVMYSQPWSPTPSTTTVAPEFLTQKRSPATPAINALPLVAPKSATLPISKYLKSALEARGAKVFMTRTTDVDVYGPNASGVDELGARVNIANSHNSDAFVSVHINSFNNPSVGGIATYYYSKTGNDARLAQKVQNQIANVPGFNGDRGIQEGNLYVLRHTNMPAILVELGFISNPNEERALKSEQTEQDFANRIAAGIASYFGG